MNEDELNKLFLLYPEATKQEIIDHFNLFTCNTKLYEDQHQDQEVQNREDHIS